MPRNNETSRYGYPITKWEIAKRELRNILIEHAKSDVEMPTYTEIAAELTTIAFGPSDLVYALSAMLGELSVAEDEAGHGLISAIVVSKENGQPGQGFFDLAASLGKKVNPKNHESKMVFWIAEVRAVQNHWRSTVSLPSNNES
jgi:hypothetical protein